MAILPIATNFSAMKNFLSTFPRFAFLLGFLGSCTVNSEGLAVKIIVPAKSGLDASPDGYWAASVQTGSYDKTPSPLDASATDAALPLKKNVERTMTPDAGSRMESELFMDASAHETVPVFATADAPDGAGESSNGGQVDADSTLRVLPPPAADPYLQAKSECQANGGIHGVTETGPVCTFDCTGAKRCSQMLVCPSNQRCSFLCDGSNCKGGFDCSRAQACRMECNTEASCPGKIICGGKDCQLICKGRGSCSGGVLLFSTLGTIDCAGEDSCRAVECSGQQCTTRCSGRNSCDDSVLSNAVDNLINCSGEESCSGEVKCSGTRCSTTCGGLRSCEHGFGCYAASCAAR